MKQFKHYLFAAAMLAACGSLASCDNDDAESTANPAMDAVKAQKSNDTAILLCTFGSTYKESLHVYDETMEEFKAAFPDADVYMSFTSRTCIGRVEATTGEARYQVEQWLKAIGEAGYKKVAVQSLHVIPGEEYLSLMNTSVKKDFMISGYPSIKVLKGANLLDSDEDTEAVADAIYAHYKDKLADKKNIVLLMGHGNPDKNYNANDKYAQAEEALLAKAANGNVFVGTVDYGKMLFWPVDENESPVAESDIMNHPDCIYTKLVNYMAANNLNPSDITVYLAPFMSIAGDHAHNDLWGLEQLAEGGEISAEATPDNNEFSWRERLQKWGFNIATDESHPTDRLGADHGVETGCTIKSLGDYAAIRKIWLNHLKAGWNNEEAWEDGEGYQPEA